jgi:N-acetyl-gamma-glutamyl-phosphate reductase common form
MPEASHSVGLVGARGHVGAELLRLLAAHPDVDLAFASSRKLAGEPLSQLASDLGAEQRFELLDAEAVAQRAASQRAAGGVDAVFLALPNDLSHGYVEAIDAAAPGCVIIDLSADHRFDDGWAYGLVERHRAELRGATRIANPGCYATAAQLAIAPLLDKLSGPPQVFGISGYSGAGTTPSPRNDPEQLRDNLMPYKLTGHIHEREISRHLDHEVHFMPHVASFFRGISLTIHASLDAPYDSAALLVDYHRAYQDEPLVRVQSDIPLVREAANQHHVTIGGIDSVDRRAVLVATIDNLLKGAATQAVQNLNLALGLDELTGLPV